LAQASPSVRILASQVPEKVSSMFAVCALVALCALPAAGADSLREQASSQLQAFEEARARDTFKDTGLLLDGLGRDVGRLELLQTHTVTAPQHAAVEKKTLRKKPVFDVGAAVQQMGKTTQLAPMLGLVSGMYDAWKDKISDANKHEQDSKKEFNAEIKELEAKKAKFKGDANGTKTYDNIEKYWQRQRSISHRQYHTALKLMHGGMEKFKTVMGAMKDAAAGKKPSNAEMSAMQQLAPEVVFLQEKVTELRVWSSEAASELRAARLHSKSESLAQQK